MNLIKKYRAWKEGKKNASNPAPVDLPHIWRVIKALFRKTTIKETDYRAEQAKWRLSMKVDPICKAQETCKICSCFVEDLVWEDSSCEGNCYPPLMDKKTWDSYKKQNRIK